VSRYFGFATAREGRLALVGAVTLGLGLVVTGCASPQVNDLENFELIAMSRVVPYPAMVELKERAFDVVLTLRDSEALDETVLEDPWRWAREELEGMVEDAGATVVPLSSTRHSRSTKRQAKPVIGIDYVLAVRFDTYIATSSWKPPYRFLWESTDEVAFQPGTCLNRVDVDYRVDVIEEDSDGSIVETFLLRHSAEMKSKDANQACDSDPELPDALFETTMRESISCLRSPIDRLLAPRGHVTAHRYASDLDQHLFQISLGSRQGIERGEAVEVRREQHASRPTGEAWRTERVIARGVVTDRIEEEAAWVAIDPARADEEILAGDVVRPVLREGLILSLSGPDCKKILEIR
jgi:hypothetical protein